MSTNLIWGSILLIMVSISCNSLDSISLLDPNTPGITPQIFAPNFISLANQSEYGSTFNEQQTDFYYGVDINGKSHINHTQFVDNKWSTPVTFLIDDIYSYNDPMLSPAEDELYFISSRPINEADTTQDFNIWYIKKDVDRWSEPINPGNAINSDEMEYYTSFSSNKTLYYASNKQATKDRAFNFDIYKSEFKNGTFRNSDKLSDAINSRGYEGDVFIAPDESYIIFTAARKEGVGKGDLYISFKEKNDGWTKSVLMGNTINTESNEICPFVTQDGRYLFYTSNKDIYWVQAEIIESFK